MPSIPSPLSQCGDAFIEAVAGALLEMAGREHLSGFTPAGSPGHVAYTKSQKYVQQVLENPIREGQRMAVFVSMIDPSLTQMENARYRYLIWDNPSGRNVFENQLEQASWTGSVSMPSRLWDLAAGITQEDITLP